MSTGRSPLGVPLTDADVAGVVAGLLAGQQENPAGTPPAGHATRTIEVEHKVPLQVGRASTVRTWYAWGCSTCGIDTTGTDESTNRATAERKADRHAAEPVPPETGYTATLRWYEQTAAGSAQRTESEDAELARVRALMREHTIDVVEVPDTALVGGRKVTIQWHRWTCSCGDKPAPGIRWSHPEMARAMGNAHANPPETDAPPAATAEADPGVTGVLTDLMTEYDQLSLFPTA